MTFEAFNAELDILLNAGMLSQSGDFILSPNGTEQDIERRVNGNAGAQKIMPLAYQYSKKIASFPFVEGVCLSGALSKNYYDEKGDIDFFIITRPGRLWICRTLLILRYKLLPKSRKKFWCTNYFIASDALYIPDNNAFTGTELAYLIPTVNYSAYRQLLDTNTWYRNRFPNKSPYSDAHCLSASNSWWKRTIETVLGGAFGRMCDNFLLLITLRHWQKKYPELSKEDFELQFRSRKNVCKRHSHGFQNKVLYSWEKKQRDFSRDHNVIFS